MAFSAYPSVHWNSAPIQIPSTGHCTLSTNKTNLFLKKLNRWQYGGQHDKWQSETKINDNPSGKKRIETGGRCCWAVSTSVPLRRRHIDWSSYSMLVQGSLVHNIGARLNIILVDYLLLHHSDRHSLVQTKYVVDQWLYLPWVLIIVAFNCWSAYLSALISF